MRGIAKLNRVAGWLCVGVLGLASAATATAEKPSQRHAELVQRLADTKADRDALTEEIRRYEQLAERVAGWARSDRQRTETDRQRAAVESEQAVRSIEESIRVSRRAAVDATPETDADPPEMSMFIQPNASKLIEDESRLRRFLLDVIDSFYSEDLTSSMADLEHKWLRKAPARRSPLDDPEIAEAIRKHPERSREIVNAQMEASALHNSLHSAIHSISRFRGDDDAQRLRLLLGVMVQIDRALSQTFGQDPFWDNRAAIRADPANHLSFFPFQPARQHPASPTADLRYRLYRELDRETRRLGTVGFDDLPDEVHRLRMRVADRRSLLSGVEAEIETLSQEIEAAEAALHDAAAGLLDGSTAETELGESVSFGVRGEGASVLVMTVNDRDYTLVVRPEMRRRTPPVFAARADGGSPESNYNFKTETDAFSVPALDRRRAFVFVGLLSIEVESSEEPVDHRSVMRWFKAAADLEALAAL